MQRKTRSKFLTSILCMMLIVAMALCTAGCNKAAVAPETPDTAQEQGGNENDAAGTEDSEIADAEDGEDAGAVAADVTELGEGQTEFPFSVIDKDGKETKFLIHTDKKTVGEALFDVNLIEGEEGQFGLYVKKVNGITADYDIDQTFWSFCIDGEMAMSGVDMTDIEAGAAYAFKVEK